jgi:hypothetical protein
MRKEYEQMEDPGQHQGTKDHKVDLQNALVCGLAIRLLASNTVNDTETKM